MSEVIPLRPANPEADFGALIDLYLETRNAKAKLESEQKKHVKQYADVLNNIEGNLRQHRKNHGGQSLSSTTGTAYIASKRSAPTHDAAALKTYVIDNEAWDMLDWKATVPAVADFLQENNVPPP